MANFTVTVEASPRNDNIILVRHRDGKTRLPNGRLKRFLDYRVEKTESMVIDGKKLIGKQLANALAEKVKERFYMGELKVIDVFESLSELVETYLESKKNKAWRTRIVYRQSLQCLMESVPALGQLTKDNLMVWRKTLEKRYANNTVWGRMNVASMFCRWLVKQKKMIVSPFEAGMIPAKTGAVPRFYTTTEFLDLENEAMNLKEIYVKRAFRLAHDHGLRKVEIVGDGRERLEGVLWEDLIWRSDGKVDLVIRKEVTKGQKKTRKIRLDPKFVAELGSRQSGPLVPITRSHLEYIFSKAREKAPIKKNLTFHGQRHSFGKNFMQAGGNQKALRDLYGHSDLKTTDIYSQFEETYLDDCMDRTHAKRQEEEALVKVAGQKDDIIPEIVQPTEKVSNQLSHR